MLLPAGARLYDELGNSARRPRSTTTSACSHGLKAAGTRRSSSTNAAASVRRRIGDEVDAAVQTHNIAEVLSDQGHAGRGAPLFEESLRVWRAADYGIGVAYATSSLGRVASRGGDFDAGRELFAAAREQFHAARPRRSWSTPTRGSPRRWCCRPAAKRRSSSPPRACNGRLWAAARPRTRCSTGFGATPTSSGVTVIAPGGFRREPGQARERHARYEVALTLDAMARAAERRGDDDPRHAGKPTTCSPRSVWCSSPPSRSSATRVSA